MKPSLWLRLDVLARKLTPFGLTVLLVLVGLIPLHVPDFSRVAPTLAVMAVYYWTIFRPGLLPAPAVFLVGLLQDILSGMPIGINTVVLLGVYGVVLSQRRFFAGKSFVILWLGFALVAGGAELASWLLISLYHSSVVAAQPVFFQYLVTLGSFPLLAWFFMRWQHAFLRLE